MYGEEIAGKTVGLIGFGPINQAVARRARAFDLEVIVLRRSAARTELADEVVGPDGLHDMLGRCDIVVAAVPESPETHELFDSAAFAAMRDGSMFVNVGRGTLVHEPALADALHSGKLRAAAIDVTAVEPLPEDSPCGTLPTSTSPHTAPPTRAASSNRCTRSLPTTWPATWPASRWSTRSLSSHQTRIARHHMDMGVCEHPGTLLAALRAQAGCGAVGLHNRAVLPYSRWPTGPNAPIGLTTQGGPALMSTVASDLVIELENKPGALARVATAISDAGVNIAAATCMGTGRTAELHILVPHSEPVYRALANTQGPAVTREREVVVVQAQDRPGELAELATKVSKAGINLDMVYVATNSRVVLGSEDTDALKEVLDGFSL